MSERTTDLTSSVAWGHSPVGSNAGRYDAPWDFTRPARPGSRKRVAHRFPAAVHLRPPRVREERALAVQALAVLDEAASSRIGIAVGFLAGLAVTGGTLAVTGGLRTSLSWWLVAGLGILVVLVLGGLVSLLRRHAVLHEQLSQRALLYELRLAELDEQRRAAQASLHTAWDTAA